MLIISEIISDVEFFSESDEGVIWFWIIWLVLVLFVWDYFQDDSTSYFAVGFHLIEVLDS